MAIAIRRVPLYKRVWRYVRFWFIESLKSLSTADHSSSFLWMLILLSRGKDADGRHMRVWEFNARSTRKLIDLYWEIKNRDVLLVLNHRTGRVEQHAQKVCVTITNIVLGLVWYETARRYPGGKILYKKQDFTVRETRKRGQSALEALLAGLEQEQEYYPSPNEIKSARVFESIEPVRESTVYYGIVSANTMTRYEIRSTKFYRKSGHARKDYSDGKRSNNKKHESWVETVIEHFPYP